MRNLLTKLNYFLRPSKYYVIEGNIMPKWLVDTNRKHNEFSYKIGNVYFVDKEGIKTTLKNKYK